MIAKKLSETKETILNLQNQEKKNRLCTEEEKQEAVKTWRGLSEQINSDTPSSNLVSQQNVKNTVGWRGCHSIGQ